MAAFAPLIANHRPYVVWGDGVDGVQFPVARAMTTGEWLGIGVFILGVLFWCFVRHTRRSNSSVQLKRAIAAGTIALVIIAAAAIVLASSRQRLDRVDYGSLKATDNVSMVFPPVAHGWAEVHLDERYQPPGRSVGDGELHVLGTDDAGADVLARLVYGARIAVLIGLLSAGLALLIGVALGLGMGALGGWFDLIGMRAIELFMAVPRLLLVLTVVVFLPTRDSGVSLAALVAVIGLTGWMRPARLVRSEALRARNEDYVAAARAMGLSRWSIVSRHILPNAIAPALVDGGFMVASAVLMETNLSFLGLGVKSPQPSWGLMLSQAIDRSTGEIHWWLALGPGIMILLTVLICHSIAESQRRRKFNAIEKKL